jgi:hypothetical protein
MPSSELDRIIAALAIAEDKRALEKRLRGAVYCLRADLRPRFKRARFDFTNRRLIGDGFALQWQLRENPGAPESPTNQQTNEGIVKLVSGELVA